MGQVPGKANVYVNGEYALTMDLGPLLPRGWFHDDYRAAFRARAIVPDGLCGILYLTIPDRQAIPGQSAIIRIVPLENEAGPFLILHQITDTLRFEQEQGTLDDLPDVGEQWIEGYSELIHGDNCAPKPDYRDSSMGCWFRGLPR